MAGSIIQATRTLEFEDGLNRRNQNGASNSLHWIPTILEVNAIIGFRGGLDQVSQGREKSNLLHMAWYHIQGVTLKMDPLANVTPFFHFLDDFFKIFSYQNIKTIDSKLLSMSKGLKFNNCKFLAFP